MQTKDYTSAITALKYAVSIDATFSRAWIELGLTYAASNDKSSTLDALQKAVEADPKQVLPYKMLALNYMFLGNQDNAIATWQRLQSVAPDDPDLALYLGALYMGQRRYADAASLLESAVKANPSNAYAQMMLGTVRLRSHNTDQALDAFHKALEIDSGALLLNNVAYELAEGNTNLPEALGYSQRSVKEVEERSQKVNMEKIQKADLQLSAMIGAYWDTLGWIYFKVGDLARAESYLNSAWQLTQDGLASGRPSRASIREGAKTTCCASHVQSRPRSESPFGRYCIAHAQSGPRASSEKPDECCGRIDTDAYDQASYDHQRNCGCRFRRNRGQRKDRKGEFFPGARNASPCWREPNRESLVGRAVPIKLDGTPDQKWETVLF
jgi:tetratricopeptide (TPR) repeat protein